MAARKYKLTYFDVRGMGEPVRYMFALANVDYEDNRMESRNWPSIKPDTPFGQVPMLEIDGEVFAQSRALCRYLADQFDLMPTSGLDRLRADSIVDAVDEARVMASNVTRAWRTGDTEAKEKLSKLYESVDLPPKLESIEKYLKSDKFIAGNEITWADVYFTAMIQFIKSAGKVSGFNPNLDKFPKICGIVRNVENQPRIASYIAARKPNVQGV